MKVEVGFEVIELVYDGNEYRAWKARDSSVVPEYALQWGGSGVQNGYGYAEWTAAQYFHHQGYNSIISDFNLVSKQTKFVTNNQSHI